MAGKKSSAEKRHAQSEVRRLHNKAIKSTCRTYAKQFVEAVQAKDQKLAEEKYKTLQKALDSAYDVIFASVGDEEKARKAADSLDSVLRSFGIYNEKTAPARGEFLERITKRVSRSALNTLGGGNLIDRLRRGRNPADK